MSWQFNKFLKLLVNQKQPLKVALRPATCDYGFIIDLIFSFHLPICVSVCLCLSKIKKNEKRQMTTMISRLQMVEIYPEKIQMVLIFGIKNLIKDEKCG